jgi:hypothetical protein
MHTFFIHLTIEDTKGVIRIRISKRTDNKMAKRKGTKGQTTISTILSISLYILSVARTSFTIPICPQYHNNLSFIIDIMSALNENRPNIVHPKLRSNIYTNRMSPLSYLSLHVLKLEKGYLRGWMDANYTPEQLQNIKYKCKIDTP